MIKKTNKNNTKKSSPLKTSIGELVEAIYEVALEEYMDEILARRIAMQALLRKVRQHDHYMEQVIKKD
jgi:hypothetical protein